MKQTPQPRDEALAHFEGAARLTAQTAEKVLPKKSLTQNGRSKTSPKITTRPPLTSSRNGKGRRIKGSEGKEA
jgi:hypothetical protein